jgi:hypothetical protein
MPSRALLLGGVGGELPQESPAGIGNPLRTDGCRREGQQRGSRRNLSASGAGRLNPQGIFQIESIRPRASALELHEFHLKPFRP